MLQHPVQVKLYYSTIMTSKDYITNIKVKYPNTYIGLNAFHKNLTPNMIEFISTYGNVPLDYTMSKIIPYIEYRQVNFLEAMCNLHFDYPDDNHETLRMKTVTNILYRLEKYINPVEGQPF